MKTPTLSLVLALSSCLVACGKGSDSKPAQAGAAQNISSAAVTHSGPCPMLNGKFVREHGEERDSVLYFNTMLTNGLYSYSFNDPRGSLPNYEPADGVFRQMDIELSAREQLTCNANTITSVTMKPNENTIQIRFIALTESKVEIRAEGGGLFLNGIYNRIDNRR